MREIRDPQQNLFHIIPRNAIGEELEGISKVLEANQQILDIVYADLVGLRKTDTGRTGMTAEQVLRCAILKQYRELTYQELAFHLGDSKSFRAFARLSRGQTPSASTLQENIKTLSEETWEALNRAIVGIAKEQGIEKGRTVRMDSTAVESNIHYPTDSSLLEDGIRVITGLLIEGKQLSPTPTYRYCDHRRVAKKRGLAILNDKKKLNRKKWYKDLLDIAWQVRGYALDAIGMLESFVGPDLMQVIKAHGIAEELERLVVILDQVMDQTRRRVIEEEKVPASEKVISFFECHSDIIEKGERETIFGHKVFVVGGSSGLILDCVIKRGNPADSSLFIPLVERQEKLYGRPPRQTSADGGFAATDNLRIAKKMGVSDVSFAKRRGLSVLEMVKSTWVYKKLRNFRAGIEANISVLKRAFGLTRCTWTGWDGFVKYVRSAIFSYNLLTLARLNHTTA
jgi:transposase, IS5 family